MKIEQRTVYIAEDGSEWDNEEGCKNRDRLAKLQEHIYEYSSCDMSSDEIACYIHSRWYDIKGIIEGSYD